MHLSITLFLTAHLSNTPDRHPTAVSKSYLSASCLLRLDLLHLDHPTEPYNCRRPTKQNQPRMVLALGGRDFSSKRKHCALRTSVTRLRFMAHWTQQSTAPWCLFNSITRKVGSTNVALGHSSSEATSKRLGKEETQFDYFDGSCIQGFGNTRHLGYGKTRWHDLLSRAW